MLSVKAYQWYPLVARPALRLAAARLPLRRWNSSASDAATPSPRLGDEAVQVFTPEEDAMVKIRHDVDAQGRRTGVTVVSFNQPDKMNALTVELGKVFEKKMRMLRTEPHLRAVILTGEGKGFSAGGDLDWLAERAKDTLTNNHVTMRMFYDRFLSIRRLPVPVIAAINGAAIGAGLCLSLACDIRLAAEGVKLGFNFVNIGIHPGMGGTHFLPQLTSTQVAARLMLTGDIITAEKAKELGIVMETHPREQLMDEALSMARRIAAGSPSAVRAVTQTLRLQQDHYANGMSKNLDWEAENQARNYATGDVLEGVAAIRERRSPNFGTSELPKAE